MSAMELYLKFVLTLTIGLVGLSVVLMTLLETVLCEWDPLQDLRRWWRAIAHRPSATSLRAEDILSELEGRRGNRFVYAARPPAPPIDLRHEILRDGRHDQRVPSLV